MATMAIIHFTIEEIRDPYDSGRILIRNEDAADCCGEVCGQYHEEDGVALKPRPHGHLVITGLEPATTPRRFPISKQNK